MSPEQIDTTTIDGGLKIGRCRDCRWWDGKVGDSWGVCARFSTLDGERMKPGGRDKALIGGAFANLVTDDDFGCVQFEERRESR